MNVTDAVLSRRSVRAFLDRPVPQETLRRVVETASRAPSNSNMQPWLVRVLTGDTLARLKSVMRERAVVPPQFDQPKQYSFYPDELKDPYLSRRAKCAERQYSAVGIPREDHEGRLRYVYGNMQCFGAPAAMFTFIENGMGPSQWADLGCFLQTVMLLLQEAGIDSCAQISWCNFARTVCEVTEVPDDWTLYCGLSIGYADPDAPVNTVVADRVPIDDFAKFLT
jgi:nitroreductase